ncbi:MAG: DJ-1/PfpI family protein [Alphaproteobacteria bacterium]|nr:DJ-1/PfpI family protein [Alphaproteobacteria bacterium]|tara:strand:+ start:845 stop:1462 length:618 start_codon:yes stop_codon:yes gene_type:complete
MKKINVGIFIFDEVEVLDFAGPFEVFSRTRLLKGAESRRSNDSAPFNPFTVSIDKKSLTATGGLKIIADYTFNNFPKIDILIVPGGYGTRTLLNNEILLKWIKAVSDKANITASVCTGSLLLAKAGLLEGKRATTHWGAIEALKSISKDIQVITERRVVNDEIITSAGVSSGIDMAFMIVENLYGEEVASDTSKYIEFHRSKENV